MTRGHVSLSIGTVTVASVFASGVAVDIMGWWTLRTRSPLVSHAVGSVGSRTSIFDGGVSI